MPDYLMLDQRRPRRSSGGRVLAAIAILVALIVVAGAIELGRGVGPVRAVTVLPGTVTVPGQKPALPWPKHAAAAVAVDGLGSLGGVRTTEKRPLASVVKLFTALVVLREHPLKLGQSGPLIPVTAADAASYRADAAAHDSVLRVRAGERLTELQALEGMLIPSADNLARLLATWSDGSRSSFVQAMNNEASRLGLQDTHLAGPAGLNAASVSTPTDLLKVAEAVMANPVLRQIVAMPAVTLPNAGTVYNLNDVLGRDGIVGIKTGSTPNAGGNFVFASEHRLSGVKVTVVGAILGATGVNALQNALDTGARLSAAAARQARRVVVMPKGRVVLKLSAPWTHPIPARTTAAARLLALPGSRVSVHVVLEPALARGKLRSVRAGQRVASVELQANGRTTDLPVTAARSLPKASLSYRLLRF